MHRPRILQWLTHVTETRLALHSHVAQVFPPTVAAVQVETAVAGEIEESLRVASLPGPLAGAQQGAQVSGKHGPRLATWSCPTCHLWFPDLAALKKHHAKHHASPVAPPHPTANAAEVRQHSVDGMPVCRHCGKDYVTWFNLKRHIQQGHCVRRWRDALQSRENSTGAPISASSTVVLTSAQVQLSEPDLQVADPVAAAPASGEPVRADMQVGSPTPGGPFLSLMPPASPTQWLQFARRPEVREKLQHFCVTCGQWLVSVKSIKLHYRHTHGDIYQRFCRTAAADCRKVGHLISPCAYCGTAITRTDQHSSTCPVLWQARVCCLVQADLASKSSAQPVLRLAMEHVPTQMELDEEERQCFGNLLGKRALALGTESPSKYPHPGGKGAPQNGGGRPRQFPLNRGPRQSAPSQGSRSKEDHRGRSGTSSDELLHKVAKALIVQSDYLSRLQSDHTVIFTFRNGDGPQLMVPLLHEVTANWRDQRSKGKVTKSLKQTLLQYVTAEIITRVTTFASDKSAQAKAQEMGWVTSDLEYNYLDWNAEEQRLVPRQEGTLTQDQVLADARRLKNLLKQQELILKFSAARNAQPDSNSETATFVLELSMQIPEAAEAMAICRKWFATSALLLLSLRLKPAPARSGRR